MQRIQEQTARGIREFYGDSLGNLKDRVQSDRSQLEGLAERLPCGAAQAQIKEMIGSYSTIEGLLDRAAGQVSRGAEEIVDQAVSGEGHEDEPAFENVETFCMFIGYPRSGHSLVGALLDAHPNAVIAHELNALECVEKGFVKERIFRLVLENSQKFAKSGRRWDGYSYKVPSQWQGRFKRLRVIGDKKGGGSTRIISSTPDIFQRLQAIIDTDVRFIHVVRNPYDNISSMYKHRQHNQSLRSIIDRYFDLCKANAVIKEQLGAGAVFEVSHESFIKDPEQTLRELCAFLDLECEGDYLTDCTSIVFASPHKTRHAIEWNSRAITMVQDGIDRHDFLKGYSYSEAYPQEA